MYICLGYGYPTGDVCVPVYYVLDTADGVVESFTKDEIKSIVVDKGIEVRGLTKASQWTFDVKSPYLHTKYSKGYGMQEVRFSHLTFHNRLLYGISYSDFQRDYFYACGYMYNPQSNEFHNIEEMNMKWDELRVVIDNSSKGAIFKFMYWDKHYYREDDGATLEKTVLVRQKRGEKGLRIEFAKDWVVSN